MTDIAIRVDNLSKLYHIGMLQQRHDTFGRRISLLACGRHAIFELGCEASAELNGHGDLIIHHRWPLLTPRGSSLYV